MLHRTGDGDAIEAPHTPGGRNWCALVATGPALAFLPALAPGRYRWAAPRVGDVIQIAADAPTARNRKGRVRYVGVVRRVTPAAVDLALYRTITAALAAAQSE